MDSTQIWMGIKLNILYFYLLWPSLTVTRTSGAENLPSLAQIAKHRLYWMLFTRFRSPMPNHLTHIFIFFAAGSLNCTRFKLGSVIGYLIIGVLIGPYCFNLVGNGSQIMHFSEFGIVMMLFLIGLELDRPCYGVCEE